MGVRKKLRANQLKEERKNTYVAKLNGCPTSPLNTMTEFEDQQSRCAMSNPWRWMEGASSIT